MDRSHFRESYPPFRQPQAESIALWRYMDLPRFVAVLSAQQLLLTRADLLVDVFEGTVTALAESSAERLSSDWAFEDKQTRITMRNQVYVSCWHANNSESEGMWRLYCGPREGIAFRTSYQRLKGALPLGAYIGELAYIDFETDREYMNYRDPLLPFILKRIEFQYEREVRVIAWRNELLWCSGVPIEEIDPHGPEVFGVRWQIEDVLEQIIVSPYAPRWYRDVVEAVLDRFQPSLSKRLEWSRMRQRPHF
jgi:hypothetical protein